MSKQDLDKELAKRIARDCENAVKISQLAEAQLSYAGKPRRYDPLNDGDIEIFSRIQNIRATETESLRAIEHSSFHAMIEICTATEDVSTSLRYINKDSNVNQVLGGLPVHSWTHPIAQVALSCKIGEPSDIEFDGLDLSSIVPFDRAKFYVVRPRISGVYEPGVRVTDSIPQISGLYESGGRLYSKSKMDQKAGLKAVKLDMSREQVQAFISRMSGIIVIIGAPGSGKTTVALQRIRFLFNQQQLGTEQTAKKYKPELTKVFLANKNLEHHAIILLEKELQINSVFEVITGIDKFVASYLKFSWSVRNRATQVRVRFKSSQRNFAREAIVGLAEANDLKGLWLEHEKKVKLRLSDAGETLWSRRFGADVELLVNSLKEVAADAKISSEPNNSWINMERLYQNVNTDYDRARYRIGLRSRNKLEPFENKFKMSYERARRQVQEAIENELESFERNFEKPYFRAIHQTKSTSRQKLKSFGSEFVKLYEQTTNLHQSESRKSLESIVKKFNRIYSQAKHQIQSHLQNDTELFDRPFTEMYKQVREKIVDELAAYCDEPFRRNIRARRMPPQTSTEKLESFEDSYVNLYKRAADQSIRTSQREWDRIEKEFKNFYTHRHDRQKFGDSASKAKVLYDKPYIKLYEYVRKQILRELEWFDNEFKKWLYNVYDPISSMYKYFASHKEEVANRLDRSIGETGDIKQAIITALREWKNNKYRPEDSPWIAWLLRFSLPRSIEKNKKFKNLPSATAPAYSFGEQWSHIVVDEAQDLSVAEASLLGSLVAPKGALTISLDVKQIVSRVKGMKDTNAFYIGKSLTDQHEEKLYPFGKNFRQSQEIGKFLQEFYQIAFEEKPPFDVNIEFQDHKPRLIIADQQDFARRICQLIAEFEASEYIESVGLIQVEEDIKQVNDLRDRLRKENVQLAEANQAYSNKGLVISTVEKIKGLEFDACILLGIENVYLSSQSTSKNRAYVGLSRPTRRLILLCEKIPLMLRSMDQSLFHNE